MCLQRAAVPLTSPAVRCSFLASVRKAYFRAVTPNYSYLHRDFDIQQRTGVILPLAFELTDVPGHKGFAYVDWSPTPRLHVVPSVEAASNCTTLASTTPTPPGVPFYYRTGSYVQGNVRIDYEVVDGIQIGVGARNLFDDNYQLADGFPEQGRSFFASLRARY